MVLARKALNVVDRIAKWQILRRLGPYHGIQTHLTKDEKILLYRLAKSVKGLVYVEIGSYLGASACCLAQAIRDANPRARLYCVDTWNNEGMSEGPRDTFADFCSNTRAFESEIVACRGRSREVAERFDRHVDFVFFDGDHSLTSVEEDWNSWSLKMKPDTVVVFHDYEWADGVRHIVNHVVTPRTREYGQLPNMWWGRLSG